MLQVSPQVRFMASFRYRYSRPAVSECKEKVYVLCRDIEFEIERQDVQQIKIHGKVGEMH